MPQKSNEIARVSPRRRSPTRRQPWIDQLNPVYGETMPNASFKKLYIDELKDLYSAENQLVKALPKMAKAASSEDLRHGFEGHLDQTKEHVVRLEKIFK